MFQGFDLLRVVIIMGILEQYDNNSGAIQSKSKIPDYARDYRNEYLFIRGINEACENFEKKLGREEILKVPKLID